MPKVNTEFFIARRIASGKAADHKNIMVRIATATVAVSIAVMIVAVSVINGFKRDITGKLVGFGAHIQVVNIEGNNSFESPPIVKNYGLEQELARIDGISSLQPYAYKGGILKTNDTFQGVLMKGVTADYDWDFFSKNLVSGHIPVYTDTASSREIIVSETLSRLTGVGVGDRVEILFHLQDRAPRRDQYKVTGIYNTGLQEMDLMVIPTHIRNIQRINGWSKDQIMGYELTTDDFSNQDGFLSAVKQVLRNEYRNSGQFLTATDIRDRFPGLFDWLRAHNVNAAVIITIMILVSLLNMISALLIILLERTKMIGTLKALGMNNWGVQKVFLLRSSYILLKGILWGNIVGIGICLLQKYTHFMKLDQSGYFVSEVPVSLQPGWLVLLNAGTLILLLLMLTVPTRIVSFIRPDKTIRYQ